MLQPPPNARTRRARIQPGLPATAARAQAVYPLVLHETVIDEAIDALIRDGLQFRDRHDPRCVAQVLSPLVELWLRAYRDRTSPVDNLFGRRR